MRILGITGGVATGKSTVTALLGECGASTMSADAVAREQLQPGTAVTRAVLAAFPGCIDAERPDAVDRPRLGRLVFADPIARKRLEALTHPPVIAALRAAVAGWRLQRGGCVALEIPLLFEAGLEDLVDDIIVVACRPETQVARLMARVGIDEAEARRRIAAQWRLKDKIARARTTIRTDQSLDDTRRQVLALWEEYCR